MTATTLARWRWLAAAPLLAAASVLAAGYVVVVRAAEAVADLGPVDLDETPS